EREPSVHGVLRDRNLTLLVVQRHAERGVLAETEIDERSDAESARHSKIGAAHEVSKLPTECVHGVVAVVRSVSAELHTEAVTEPRIHASVRNEAHDDLGTEADSETDAVVGDRIAASADAESRVAAQKNVVVHFRADVEEERHLTSV